MKITPTRWLVLAAAILVLVSMLGFSGNSGAAPKGTPQPFANPVEQNNEIIRELREIRALLQEQNGLLRAGREGSKTGR